MMPLIRVSMVSDAINTATRDVRADKIIDAIQKGKWRTDVEQIRRLYARTILRTSDRKAAKKEVEPLKKNLPAILWSGTFKQRNKDALIQYSRLICADLDDLDSEKLADARTNLLTSPYLYALFRSPTKGLKAVIRCAADAARHPGSFRAAEKHVRELAGIQIDQSGKDLARMCFVSYDPDCYFNPNALVLEPLPEPEKPKALSNNAIDLSKRQRIMTELLGEIDWQSETDGFATCPGKHLHTTGDGERDCKVELDNVPTVHCFHNSCRGILNGVNHELRSRIGKAEYTEPDDAQANGEDETIARLASMPLLEYERVRKDEAKKLGCRESIFDSLVNARRLLNRPPGESDNLQGEKVKLGDVEPWPESVNGAEILDAISERFTHYVVLPAGAKDALPLWCAHTHLFRSFQTSPRLNICAPTQECGKTTLLDCVTLFSNRAERTDNMSTAAMFRLVAGHRPTILADESEKWIFNNEELLGLFNSGHRKGGHVLRCEGDTNELRKFNAYAPIALAGVGALPSQLHSRSISIRLERATRDEIKKRARFINERTEYEHELCRKLARWCNDNRDRIAACDPNLPENIFNRTADNWRPLFAIAEIAGGDWPRRCANALVKLTTGEDDAENLRVLLLTDIRQVFTADRMFSKDLIDALAEIKERPWPEVCRGKPITERWLARNLFAFGIRPKLLRIGENKPARGYELVDFREPFARYLPDTGNLSVTPLQHEGDAPFSSVTSLEFVTLQKVTPYIGDCNTVTLEKGEQA